MNNESNNEALDMQPRTSDVDAFSFNAPALEENKSNEP
jgi:hypothetical protein